jgi:hypothetical protein
MAEAISDRQVVATLRPFVRAAGPVLAALREVDLFGLRGRDLHHRTASASGVEEADELDEIEPGLRVKIVNALASVKVPGTAAWAAMTVDERVKWWVNRVGRITALLTSVPGLGGALADRFPVQDALGSASQGLLLCAIAGEHGVDDVADRVRLIAWVLFERDIDPAIAAGKSANHDDHSHDDHSHDNHRQDKAAEDAETEKLTEEFTASQKRGRIGVKACATTLWRLGRSLLGIAAELGKRPSGRFYHHALGMLPVVGMAGDYLGERSGLKRVVKRANKWLARNGSTPAK